MRARCSCAFEVPAEISSSTRDLPVLVAVHVVQHENPPRAVRKPRDGGLEIHRQVARRRRCGQPIEDPLVVVEPAPGHRLRPEALDHHVHRQPVQPGPERRGAPESGELVPGADEDVLRHFVGIAPGGHPPHQAVHLREVGSIQRFEGAHVSSRGGRHVVVCHSGRGRAGLVRLLLALEAQRSSPQSRRRRGRFGPSSSTPGWTERPVERLECANGEYRRGRAACLPTTVCGRRAGRPRSAGGACSSVRCRWSRHSPGPDPGSAGRLL